MMPNAITSAVEQATLLAVSADLGDSKALEAILENWTIKPVQTCAEALAALRRSKCAAVLCEKELPDGNWRDLLESLARFGQTAGDCYVARGGRKLVGGRFSPRRL